MIETLKWAAIAYASGFLALATIASIWPKYGTNQKLNCRERGMIGLLWPVVIYGFVAGMMADRRK